MMTNEHSTVHHLLDFHPQRLRNIHSVRAADGLRISSALMRVDEEIKRLIEEGKMIEEREKEKRKERLTE